MKYIFKYLVNGFIGIDSKIAFKVNYNGFNTLINTNTIDSRQAISFSDDFDWINSKQCEILNIEHKLKSEKITSRNIYIYKNKGFFDGGFIQSYKLSLISIMVELDIEELLASEEFDSIKKSISEVLIYFINTYRVVSDNCSISVPDSEKIIGLEVFKIIGEETSSISKNECVAEFEKKSEPIITQVQLEVSSISADMHIPEPTKYGHFQLSTSSLILEKLIRQLQDGVSSEVFEVLYMKAKEELLINENYLLAIVLSETAFEVFVQSSLIKLCEKNSIQELPRGKNSHNVNYIEAINNGNIIEDLLKKYLKNMFNINSTDQREFTLWYQDTYEIRNQIVHKGSLIFTKDMAAKAFNSSLNFCKKINEMIKCTIT